MVYIYTLKPMKEDIKQFFSLFSYLIAGLFFFNCDKIVLTLSANEIIN